MTHNNNPIHILYIFSDEHHSQQYLINSCLMLYVRQSLQFLNNIYCIGRVCNYLLVQKPSLLWNRSSQDKCPCWTKLSIVLVVRKVTQAGCHRSFYGKCPCWHQLRSQLSCWSTCRSNAIGACWMDVLAKSCWTRARCWATYRSVIMDLVVLNCCELTIFISHFEVIGPQFDMFAQYKQHTTGVHKS